MTYAEAAEHYDLIYSVFKDYDVESARLAATLRQRSPEAKEVLDVGCGTGQHARALGALGFEVDGVDLEPAFVRIASARNPAGRFVCGDMLELDLGRRYDAVLCLFGAIGYVGTIDRLHQAIAAMARHLRAGGILIVEPWLEPERATDGFVGINTAESDTVKVCRMARTTVHGRLSRVEFQYLFGRSSGLEHRQEIHELGLFTREEMLEAFRQAGLAAQHDPEGLIGRGLYVATRPEDDSRA
ncbi:MAG: class I SAM-dependent methyltransferase [Phycisphaerales bacterium]|nr:class I SAM-dependent methyltransferase [Phycisphaerales bacterium]